MKLTCLGGAPVGAPADVIHRIEAWPGAFGGAVQCLRSRKGDRVEQYWAEVLPERGETREHVTYTEGRITYFLKFSQDGGGARPVADCARRESGGYVCRVDLASGKRLFLVRFIDQALQFSGIRVMAFPARGVVNGTLWDMVGEDVEAGRMEMAVELVLPEDGRRFRLKREADSQPGAPVWGFSGDPAWAVMEALYTRRQPVVLEARVMREANGRQVTTTAIREVGTDNLTYLIDKLAKVEELMISELEKTRALKY